jgi:hypothetical protein
MSKIRFVEREETEEQKSEQERLMFKELHSFFKQQKDPDSAEVGLFAKAFNEATEK